MHEPVLMSCLFGCPHSSDNLQHYIECSPLWQLAGETLGLLAPFDLRERLCILNPSVVGCQLLALCFQGYHYAKSLCADEGGSRNPLQISFNMQANV